MKTVLLWTCMLASGGVMAAPGAARTCEELKGEIEANIQAKGVTVFALQIVDNQAAEGLKVVGSCGGGTKKIIYMRP